MSTPGGRPDGDLMHERVVAAIGDLYEIDAEIGRGGMAIVYSARDVKLRRRVAVKVLPPELAYRNDVRQRFVREAQTAAQLSHPNIVPIYAVDDRGGIVYFVMGLVEGPTLAQHLLATGHVDVPFVRRVLRDVADALAYAHAHGVVHRDVKPDNILLDGPAHRAVVTDFGIARAAEGDPRLTVTGVAVGTPAYMSPEQALGEREVDGRSDLYALGVVGWQLLAGELPFRATNTPAMMMKHLSEAPPPLALRAPGTPGNLVAAIERAMAKKPDDRWQDAAAFRAAVADDAFVSPMSRALMGAAPAQSVGPLSSATGPTSPDGLSQPPLALPNPVLDPVGFGLRVGVSVGSAVGSAVGAAAARALERAGGAGNAPQLPPFPSYPTSGTQNDREAWRQARRQWREQVRRQGDAFREEMVARDLMRRDESQVLRQAARDGRWDRSALGFDPDGKVIVRERPIEVRILSLRRKIIGNIAWSVVLVGINLATSRMFPWAIFPILGMGAGLWRRYDALASEGVSLGDIMLGRTPAERDGTVGAPVKSMAALRARVLGFKRRLIATAVSASAAVLSFTVGASLDLNPMIPVFIASLIATAISGFRTITSALDLKRFRVGLGDALSGRWESDFHLNNPRLAAQLMAGDMALAVPEELKRGVYGRVVESAAADRAAILDIVGRLGDADRGLIPDVVPTVRGLEERITSLAIALQRMEGTVSDDALAALDRRIADLKGAPGGTAERERTLQLLERQRQTVADLSERRGTLQAQLDDAMLLLQTMRLDLLKLRSAGVQSALDDVTNATQEARALSKEIGTVLEAANELRAI